MRSRFFVPILMAVTLPIAAGAARAGDGPKPATAEAASPAAKEFEKLKSLAGDWEGTSERNGRPDGGRTERLTFQVIAGGSCVMETSRDGAHPDQTMATMFHLDGGALLLTHYCIARNQPRLEATTIAPDLSEIVFTFRDATNLPSRDRGHMDKVVIRFVDQNRFTSRWTWYQEGKEQWFEETVFVRAGAAPSAVKTAAGGSGGCH
jgi:hypothetical protein